MNTHKDLIRVLLALLFLAGHGAVSAAAQTEQKPNIVYILCDDLGYGDVKCLGGERSKIATPNIDRLAAGGMIFTEAHSSSAVCTPTRYGILTGRYNWRTHLQSGVLMGYSPPLIDKDRITVPAFLKRHGYSTGCIGKWHLGMEISKDPNATLSEGPTTRGFDYYYGISASLDMPPFAYIENDKFTEAPTATKKWMREGAAAPGFEAEEVLPTLARKAAAYITARSTEKTPFFLYLPLTSPHTPILPAKEWQGKSGLGAYGDFVMETDWAVGEVIAAIDKTGNAANTLVIFTSDNGCSPAAKPEELENKGHFPSELRRGYKSDIWDGGHRIPFIVRWPGKVKAGGRTDQITCLTDLMATSAEIIGAKLPDNVGEDSVSILPVLLGAATKPVRETVVHHSINGSFAIRQGQWKLELCKGSGGWGKGGVNDAPGQLYDMSKDVGEQANEYNQQPEIVARLTKLLNKYVADGRSTPGPTLQNDVPVDLWKKDAEKNKVKEKTKTPTPSNHAEADDQGNTNSAKPGKPAAKAMRTTYDSSVPKPTFSEVHYGPHERNVMDFWRADSDKPTPWVFVIHGGGWAAGSKEVVSGTVDISQLLKAGISVVAINYRYVSIAKEEGVKPPVKGPMDDCARALQFVRSKAKEWNLDKQRVGAAGGSAGACSSLWLAFHDDLANPESDDPIARESTRLFCAAVRVPQTTLDPKQMKEWTPNSKYGGHAFGIVTFEKFLADRDTIMPWIKEYSPYEHVNAGDPPVYLWYPTPPALGQDQKDPTHTANFGVKLQEHCAANHVPCELVYPGAPDVKHPRPTDYLIDVFKAVP